MGGLLVLMETTKWIICRAMTDSLDANPQVPVKVINSSDGGRQKDNGRGILTA